MDEAPKTITSMVRSSTNNAVTPAAHAPKPKKNSTNAGDTSSTASKTIPRINHMVATDTTASSFFEYFPQQNARCGPANATHPPAAAACRRHSPLWSPRLQDPLRHRLPESHMWKAAFLNGAHALPPVKAPRVLSA